jgi:hypothetical protein
LKPAEAIPRLAAFYDPNLKGYWIMDRAGNWLNVNENSLRRHLRASGLAGDTKRGELISELDAALNDYQLESAVSFAGSLAGYSKGVIEQGGQRILVTTSPRLIEPTEGEFPVLTKMLENLFSDPITDQRPYVLGWLKIAFESLRAGARRPGQALAMAGPRNCGKSLLQNLITEMLGGRAAKPYRYMSGQTTFNSDLFAAEHLMVEDECGSTDLRARREFGARIKDFTVNEVQSCHAKNRQALSLRPFWRLSISLNDEPENLMILPPLDESLGDKLMLLRVHRADMPMPTETVEGRAAFWATLMAELPAFVGYLLRWEIPAALRCQRYGVATFHHPDLIDAIDGVSPEFRLLTLIDAVVFADAGPATGPMVMTAEALESQLTSSHMGFEARRLFSWTNACGTYLGRLAAKRPARIERNSNNQRREWLIKPEVVTP